MSSALRYSVDTSAILDGWRRYYPPDVFPPLWEDLEELIETGAVRSPDEVRAELEKKDDEAWRWARGQDHLFVPLDEQIQKVTAEILSKFPKLVDTRANRGQADPFVIAHARINRCTLVTGERQLGTQNRPTIPFVCRHYHVRYTDLLGLMRMQGWKYGPG